MKQRKVIAALTCVLLVLGGCDTQDGGSSGLQARLDTLNGQYNELTAENAELKKQNELLQNDMKSADEQIHDLGQENAKLESEISELKYNINLKNNEINYYESIIYNGGGYVLQYLGDERGEDGTAISVLKLRAQYVPVIRVDTKASELVMGVMVAGGWYEFVNESIDENGYLYLISDEERIPDDVALPFETERYIKLRCRNEENGQYDQFGDLRYDDAGYIPNRGFNGSLSVCEALIDSDGNARYYAEGTELHVLDRAPLVVFDGEQTE